MLAIGIIKEGKTPADNRVALTPAQCRWLLHHIQCSITVEPSEGRCFSDVEYQRAGAVLSHDVSHCDVLLGIKEVPVSQLIPNKTYLFFSHTKKQQPYNKKLMQAMVANNITLIDYECLEHEDGQRVLGFGFFAGVVGAHNGIYAYGKRHNLFDLGRVYQCRDYRALINSYFGLKLPPIKIAVTGSGRVAHGIVEVMNLMDVQEVEPEEYLDRNFTYPVYVHLKGKDLYLRKSDGGYNRSEFHAQPQLYTCNFYNYLPHTDILMNGVYWDSKVPRLFELPHMQDAAFKLRTIADITDDAHGSVPCNLGDATIEDPIYGVHLQTGERLPAFDKNGVDVMAVGNLPNELPRDASRYFGQQLIKFVFNDIINGGSDLLDRATILKNGQLTPHFSYLHDYAYH
ncbi:MAG TPA: alanine dehydrogenase [Chitinophagaceae bacterium]|nr:alanine dehydrogenase [Chitinophagaceae bacterium]